MGNNVEPFGALTPSPRREFFRRIAKLLPHNYLGRKAASALLGPAGGRAMTAFDVSVFDTQKARLHPFDNISEKRVYLTPHHWDPTERSLLSSYVDASNQDEFIFVDVGANAGLYTLFIRSVSIGAGKSLRALCIEPDPVMRARLELNLNASGAGEEILIAPYAASASDGSVTFRPAIANRGMSRLDPDGQIELEARTLRRIVESANLPRIDAMKIDIEGHEAQALTAFFASAPPHLLPKVLQVEISHDPDLIQTVISAGYNVIFQNDLNAIFRRDGVSLQTD